MEPPPEPAPLPDRLAGVEAALGYAFRDRGLLARALRHSSARAPGRGPNERLEFLGDAVLALAVSQHLFERFADAHEGELTRIRSGVVSAPTLARVAERIGLGAALEVGKGVRGERGVPPSLLADALEAVIGAVDLDGGLDAARALALRLVAPEIAAVAAHGAARNSKAILQEVLQRHAQRTPSYAILDEEGPQHERRFVAAALADGRELGRGEGRSKKEAEQRAAEVALRALLGARSHEVREGAPESVAEVDADALRRALGGSGAGGGGSDRVAGERGGRGANGEREIGDESVVSR